jgi:hypothetical protein
MILFLFLPLELFLGQDHNLKTCSMILHVYTSKSHNFSIIKTHTILMFLKHVMPNNIDRASWPGTSRQWATLMREVGWLSLSTWSTLMLVIACLVGHNIAICSGAVVCLSPSPLQSCPWLPTLVGEAPPKIRALVVCPD